MRSHTNENTEKDILRETPIRLLGYSNEVGEAFRPLLHRNVVRCSYGVAFGYCIADTVHKAVNTSRKTIPTHFKSLSKETGNEKGNTSLVMSSALDAFVWQTLASVAIPGLTINRICWASLGLLTKYSTLSTSACKWIAAVTSIASIPVIVKPIDAFVDTLLDNTLRLFIRTK